MLVAVLLTVHNRKVKTLACLHELFVQTETFKAERKYEFTVYLVDDGSTDGTSEAVFQQFPDVRIIPGDGNLYWNRGMCLAWNQAAHANPDFYLWLNDDTLLKPGALAEMLENSVHLGHKAIVAGSAVNSDGTLSYGGRTRSGKLIEPGPMIPKPCHIFNGNLVLVPASVYHVLGTMDPCYSHGFGDYDYGIRAEKAGIDSVVAPGILAVCDRNHGIPAWRDASKSLGKRYEALGRPNGRPLREQFIYDMRAYNILYAIGHFVTMNIRVLIPKRKSI